MRACLTSRLAATPLATPSCSPGRTGPHSFAVFGVDEMLRLERKRGGYSQITIGL